MVSGCYSDVIGLPICRLLEMLAELGCSLPPLEFPKSAANCRRECPFQTGANLEFPGHGNARIGGYFLGGLSSLGAQQVNRDGPDHGKGAGRFATISGAE